MLRRLVSRFSEEGEAAKLYGDKTPTDLAQNGSNSYLSDSDDEIERWIMDAGRGKPSNRILTSDAREAGRQVWVPDENDVWRMAAVKGVSKDERSYIVGKPNGRGEIEVPVKKCAEYDPSHTLDLDDASRMNQMHEAPLLDLLSRRFHGSSIYTNVADVLILVNPYKEIPGLYEIPLPEPLPEVQPQPLIKVVSAKKMGAVRGPVPAGSPVAERTVNLLRGYNQDNVDGSSQSHHVPTLDEVKEISGPKAKLAALKHLLAKPHVYGVADRAFKYMSERNGQEMNGRVRRRNQSILITGESGAGKTEASKHVMRFLITASRALGSCVRSKASAADAAVRHMEDILLRSNTVLEAFGNAKTVRNDNSSRFGKYIKLLYDDEARLVGARTEHFLLEKSRLVNIEQSERTYHILYQVAKALPESLKEELCLSGRAESFSLLNGGDCLDASEDVNDHVEFEAVDKALTSLDFSEEEKKNMWRLLAAIIHSGEVRFDDEEGSEQKCRMTESVATSLSAGGLASLWGVDHDTLETNVRTKTIKAGDENASVMLNAAQSKENLSALLKHIYRQLFAWINWKINVVFDSSGGRGADKEPGVVESARTYIGILDIFGFEIIATNSFEQFCINFANEVLQRQFNHYIFVLEQEEYGAEGLDVASIPFRDNEDIIDLISKRPAGLMCILEDQALTGRQSAASYEKDAFTDKNLLELFHQQHHRQSPHPRYRKPRFGGSEFIVMHYAGDVTYCASGFLEKNNDILQGDLRKLVLSSRNPFLRQLMLAENGNFAKVFQSSDSLSVPNGSAEDLALATKKSRNNTVKPSSNGYMNGLSREGSGKSSGKRVSRVSIAAKSTVSNGFRRQLDELVAQLGETEPHYIKCIKPNNDKSAGGWSSKLVIEQLRYSGVLEVVRIRREAFPTRVTYKQFYRRFGNLLWHERGGRIPPITELSYDEINDSCLEICEKVFGKRGPSAQFQMGTTKMFLRDDGLERLRGALRQHYHNAARAIQASWRGLTSRKNLKQQREAAKQIQLIARGLVARRRLKVMKQKALAEQAAERLRKARAAALRRKRAAKKVQATMRLWAKMCRERRARELRERNEAAVRVQAIARCYLAKKEKWTLQIIVTLKVALAALAKGYLARKWVREYRGKVVKALARGRNARAGERRLNRLATRIQALARMFIARSVYLKVSVSASRIQQAFRAYVRNIWLEERCHHIFKAVRSGDVPSVSRQLSEFPDLLFLRDRYDKGGNSEGEGRGLPSYCTLLHTACQVGSTDVVLLLEPFEADVKAPDRWGNSSLHLATASCDYQLMKVLARRANLDLSQAIKAAAAGRPDPDPEFFPVGMSKDAFRLAARMVRHLRLSDGAAPRAAEPFDAETAVANPHAAGLGMAGWTGTLEGKSGAGGRSIVEGFLKKRRETDRWLKRWCQLKHHSPMWGDDAEGGPALYYYKKKTDKVPSKMILLHHCLLKKSEHVDFAFELHSPMMMEGKNHEGRLYFSADDELELQKWMVPLRVLVKFYDFKNDKRKSPVEFLDVDKRRQLVQTKNRRGQTPLHIASAFRGGDDGDERASGVKPVVQTVVTWLAENGADPDEYNYLGETPMHVAGKAGHQAALRELEMRGGDLLLERKRDGKSARQMSRRSGELQRNGIVMKVKQLSDDEDKDKQYPKLERKSTAEQAAEAAAAVAVPEAFSGTADISPLLPPPSKMFGFTYVSVFIEKFSLPSSGKAGSGGTLSKPLLTISVYSQKGQLVEVTQDALSPASAFPNYLWWARTWHMRTPLETLGAGSVAVFELRDLQVMQKREASPVICWSALLLDPDVLDTKSELLPTFAPPTNPVGFIQSQKRVMFTETEDGGNRGVAAPPKAESILGVDVSLTRLLS